MGKSSPVGNETKAATEKAINNGPDGGLGGAVKYLSAERPNYKRDDLPKPKGGKGPAHGER